MLKQRPVASLLTVTFFGLGSLVACQPSKNSGGGKTADDMSPTLRVKVRPVAPPVVRPAAPRASRPAARRPSPKPTSVDHTGLTTLLGRYVDAKGGVDYAAWSKSIADLASLKTYLALLAAADPGGLSRAGRLAFWINAYNANVLQGVLAALPGNAGFSVSEKGFGFFDQRRYEVAGLPLSLNELENGVLRGDWGHRSVKGTAAETLGKLKSLHQGVAPLEPRIHFALVCASGGCPNLRTSAYTAADLERQLTEQARLYINDASKGANARGISALFHWFAKDFKASGGARAFVAKYYKGDAGKLAYAKELPYSWKLNRRGR